MEIGMELRMRGGDVGISIHHSKLLMIMPYALAHILFGGRATFCCLSFNIDSRNEALDSKENCTRTPTHNQRTIKIGARVPMQPCTDRTAIK